MLGSAVSREFTLDETIEVVDSPAIPWNDFDKVRVTCGDAFRELLRRSNAESKSWAVVWAAGAGVIGAQQEKLDEEVHQFREICNEFAGILLDSAQIQTGVLFFASSAGGVYGGSLGAPFDERTIPATISPYGQARLQMETIARNFSAETGSRLIIGRIANLYGPGQNLGKSQGLISQLVRSQFTPKPVSIFVPLDTRRDYIFVDDCARIISGCVKKMLSGEVSEREITKNIASGDSVSISALLGLIKYVTKKRPHVLIGQSELSSQHALDLSLASVIWTDLDSKRTTSLPDGVAQTCIDVLKTVQCAS